MRDFGFGVLTGVPYPGESRGALYTPDRWKAKSPSSIAMGYYITATPLQVAAAYVAIANGGELLQPALVKEITDPSGNPVYRHTRHVVRRVLSPETALTMRTMLASVVDSGTATAAELATYDVAGKSGTAKRAENGQYGLGHNSTFAGMFPATNPQYVFVARLIDPKGTIYGGVVAGAMVNGILQSALATRDASLDRRALAAVAKPVLPRAEKPLTPQQSLAMLRDSLRRDSLRAPTPAPVEPVPEAARVVVALPLAPAAETRTAKRKVASGSDDATGPTRAVPTVYGLDLRQAVRTLHGAGFQVRVEKGVEGRTRPASGVLARAGTTVVLESRR
jgi:cell division protein FtsI (penicillin-binding protein 3)